MDTSARFRLFDWEKAKTFYYVSKYVSFSKAAQFLHTSQPSLSRQVMALEEHLGCPLFSRQSRGVSLTRKGEQLARIIENMFLEIKEFTTDVHVSTQNTKERKIRIATSYAVAAYIINDLIIDYNESNPHLSFEIICDDRGADIFLNDVDISIKPLEQENQDHLENPKILKDFLYSSKRKLFASQQYIEKHGMPNTIEDLKNHKLMSLANSEDHPLVDIHWILKIGMPEGKKRQPIYTSNSLDCLIKAMNKNLGIISCYDIMKIVKNDNVINVLPNLESEIIKIYFYYPSYLKKDQEILNIKDYLKSHLNKYTI